MKKRIGALLVTVLGLALLIYSATRSLDFIMLTLPPDRQVLAIFGLAALDGGLVFWLLNFLYGAAGWQRAIALLMVVVDFIGAVAFFTLDTIYNTGKAGMTAKLSDADIYTAVIGLSVVIALNIAATVAYHILEPDNRKTMAQEEAFDKIDDLAIKSISQNAESLAAELAPQIAEDWMVNTRAKYQNLMTQRAKRQADQVETKPANPGPAALRWPRMRRPDKVYYNADTAAPNLKQPGEMVHTGQEGKR